MQLYILEFHIHQQNFCCHHPLRITTEYLIHLVCLPDHQWHTYICTQVCWTRSRTTTVFWSRSRSVWRTTWSRRDSSSHGSTSSPTTSSWRYSHRPGTPRPSSLTSASASMPLPGIGYCSPYNSFSLGRNLFLHFHTACLVHVCMCVRTNCICRRLCQISFKSDSLHCIGASSHCDFEFIRTSIWKDMGVWCVIY